jgi:hypothetical protein
VSAGRRLAAGAALALALAGPGCAPARVVPSGSHDLEASERRAQGRMPGVTLTVTGRPWSAPPQQLLVMHTLLWVEVRNTSERRFKVSPEDFSLVTPDGGTVDAVAPEMAERAITESKIEMRVLRSESLKPSVLEPGATTHGYVVFRKKFAGGAAGASLVLRLVVRDESGTEALGTVEAPLSLVQ